MGHDHADHKFQGVALIWTIIGFFVTGRRPEQSGQPFLDPKYSRSALGEALLVVFLVTSAWQMVSASCCVFQLMGADCLAATLWHYWAVNPRQFHVCFLLLGVDSALPADALPVYLFRQVSSSLGCSFDRVRSISSRARCFRRAEILIPHQYCTPDIDCHFTWTWPRLCHKQASFLSYSPN